MLGRIEGMRKRGMKEDEMVGWHHQFNEQEYEQILGNRERQERLACFSPQGCTELDTTGPLNNNSRQVR